jgi:hypothetical protein
METARYRQIYNTIRPRQALADRTPRSAYSPSGIRMPIDCHAQHTELVLSDQLIGPRRVAESAGEPGYPRPTWLE